MTNWTLVTDIEYGDTNDAAIGGSCELDINILSVITCALLRSGTKALTAKTNWRKVLANKPNVQPGDWITFGSEGFSRHAVVCKVYEEPRLGEIEVVYLDRDRAINDIMKWENDKWEFKYSGPGGGYADNYDRLSVYVSQLRGRR